MVVGVRLYGLVAGLVDIKATSGTSVCSAKMKLELDRDWQNDLCVMKFNSVRHGSSDTCQMASPEFY